MGVDCLDRQKLLDRIGFDRRDRIDRGVVDEEVEAIDLSGERCALALEGREIVQVSGNEDCAAIAEPLTKRARLRGAVGDGQIVQEDPASALQQSFANGQANPAGAAGDQRGLSLEPLQDALLLIGPQRDQRAGARSEGRIGENTRQQTPINVSNLASVY